MGQENLCYRANTCRQSDLGQNTLGNDNSVTGFADQSDNLQQASTPAVIPTPTPKPIPTPIPGACSEGTVFDVTLQGALERPDPFLPLSLGTVLCLNTAGLNTGITAILPAGTTETLSVTVTTQIGNQCPAGSIAAAATSGVLPSPLSGTTVCVALAT